MMKGKDVVKKGGLNALAALLIVYGVSLAFEGDVQQGIILAALGIGLAIVREIWKGTDNKDWLEDFITDIVFDMIESKALDDSTEDEIDEIIEEATAEM